MQRLVRFTFLAVVSICPMLAQEAGSRRQTGGSETSNDRGVNEILMPGRPWELLGAGYQLTADTAVDNDGNVYFTDARRNRISQIDLAGKITTWKEGSNGAHGIAYGPDGRLYAGQHDRKRIVAFASDGMESVIAEGAQTHHLTLTSRNEIYYTQAPARRVWLADVAGKTRVVDEGNLRWPRGVRASADGSRLAVSDGQTKWVWMFQIGSDGSLAGGRPFCGLEGGGESGPDAGGMVFDTGGLLYVATKTGVQVCDERGRVTGMIGVPGADGVSNVFFAGAGLEWLYVTDWERVYRRPVKRRGVLLGKRR
jgi:sugar lactone lactonase YvrE